MQQIITIAPNGIMSGLQVKKGRGVDLRQFGPAKIERASEIVFNDRYQAWSVLLLKAGGRGHALVTEALYHEATGLQGWPEGCQELTAGGHLLFGDYDDAVQAEIAVLDGLRLKGELS